MDAADLIAGARDLALFELLRQRLVKTAPVASPAAGADYLIAVPAGVMWELLSFHTRLATSAVVANRVVALAAFDADGLLPYKQFSIRTLAAGAAAEYTFAAGLGATTSNAGTDDPLPSPPMLLPGGWSLRTVTSLIDVADQFSQGYLVVREWSQQAVRLGAEWLANHYR